MAKPELDDEAQHRRDLAMHDFLDLTLGQWETWLVTDEVQDNLPPELEPHAVNFVLGLRSMESYQLYLQSLAQLTTSTLEWFIKSVKEANPDDGE